MRYGVWTPLPHAIRPEPAMEAAIADASAAGRFDGEDKAFRFAVDVIQRAEALGYETTLIAERWNGTDHPAWLLATALAALTRKIEPVVPKHYVAQIQLNMEILDLEECDFIQYRPAEGESPEEFVVVNVKRDREWFARNIDKMKAFWDGVLEGRKNGFTCEVIDEGPIEQKDPMCEVLDGPPGGLGRGDDDRAEEHEVPLVQEEAVPAEVQGVLLPVLQQLHPDGGACMPEPGGSQGEAPERIELEASEGGGT